MHRSQIEHELLKFQVSWTNLKKMKEAFVKNISIFNPMVLVSIDDNFTDCGMHFPKPGFEYLHTIFYIT